MQIAHGATALYHPRVYLVSLPYRRLLQDGLVQSVTQNRDAQNTEGEARSRAAEQGKKAVSDGRMTNKRPGTGQSGGGAQDHSAPVRLDGAQ